MSHNLGLIFIIMNHFQMTKGGLGFLLKFPLKFVISSQF